MLAPFSLERFFAKYEFVAEFLTGSTDVEALKMAEVISMADEELKSVWENLSLGYTVSDGDPLLRKEISNIYDETVEVEHIYGCIPQEGVMLFMKSVLSEGDEVVIMHPVYQSLSEHAKALGCTVKWWRYEIDEKNKRVFWDMNKLAVLMTKNTKALVVNFPHNPTGWMPSKEELQSLINLCEKNESYLFSDEMYRFLWLKESESLPSASELSSRAVSLCGMSKTFSMPGIRIGWLVVRDKNLLESIRIMKDYYSICSAAPSEVLATIVLRNRQKIFDRNLGIIKKNIDFLHRFSEMNEDLFDFYPPKGGSIGLLKIKGPLAKLGGMELAERCAQECSVMLLPGSVFDFDDTFLRIGLGRVNLPQGLERFCSWVRDTKPGS